MSFQNTYQNIFIALRNPMMGQSIDTPANPQQWKRFFGMMDTLERAEIVEFKNGRYVLHPSRKADVVVQAETLLAEISKPLTLPEPDVVEVPAPVMPEFNVCPGCKGKGRVNIEDALGFFGNFLCMTCGGKKQIPVPPRDTFPPVSLSAKRHFVNAVLFSEEPKAVAIPQAIDVGGVRVIVDAAEAVKLAVDMPETHSTGLNQLVSADCPKCSGSGILIDYSDGVRPRVHSCSECGGSGDMDDADYSNYPTWGEVQAALAMDDATQPLPAIDSPSDELPAIEPITEMGDGGFVWHDKIEASEAIAAPAPTAVEAAEAIQTIAVPIADVVGIATAPQYVRINTTGRGMSSGKYEVLRQEEKYGRSWMVVKFTTAQGLPHYFPAEICELVIEPEVTPKAIEVIAPRPSLLSGLPILQTIATHGAEATSEVLNLVHATVVAEGMKGNDLLIPEGQGA